MNRIINGVAVAQQRIDSKGLSSEKILETSRAMDMDLEEYCMFQELKSLASTTGVLTLDEAQTIYCYLGESLDTFNGQSLAVKYTLTNVFQSLLKHRIANKVKRPMFAEAA
jgi:hypothetical protein